MGAQLLLLLSRAPASAATITKCAGDLTLTTEGKFRVLATAQTNKHRRKIVTLGKVAFSLARGKTGTIKVKLSTAALKLLRTHATLKAIATIVSHDGSHKPVRTTAHITLKAPKKP